MDRIRSLVQIQGVDHTGRMTGEVRNDWTPYLIAATIIVGAALAIVLSGLV